jgi:hypothetical protein
VRRCARRPPILGLILGVAVVIIMVLHGGVIVGLGRIDVAEDPTTSGSSHLLEGMLLGVSALGRNQKSLKLPMFST